MTDKILASKPRLALDGASRRRDAVTLVELLVVMAVVVLLAGLVLPSVRTLLKDQRTSQASRVVQGFIESARARAIASGRPVAVILERQGAATVDVDTCARISLGEVFPPYEGDWSGTTGTLMDPDSSGNTDGFADSFDIPLAQAATLLSIVSSGDLIEFGLHKLTFRITSFTTVSTNVRVFFMNPPQYTNASGNIVYSSEKRLPMNGATANLRFRIYRKPSKTLAGSVVLPRGTCIDLGWSGLGTTGIDCSSSNSLLSGSDRSIFIVFNAAGSVDLVYEFKQSTGDMKPATSVLGLIHLLVGRTDQVGFSITAAPDSDREDVKANVFDTANNWVSINGFSGRVYTSDVAPPSSSNTTVATVTAAARYFATLGVNKKGI